MTETTDERDEDPFSYDIWTDDSRADEVQGDEVQGDEVQGDEDRAKDIVLHVRAPDVGEWFLAFLDGGMGDGSHGPRVVAVNGLGWEHVIRLYGSKKKALRGFEVLDRELSELGSFAFAEKYGLLDFFELDPDEPPPGDPR